MRVGGLGDSVAAAGVPDDSSLSEKVVEGRGDILCCGLDSSLIEVGGDVVSLDGAVGFVEERDDRLCPCHSGLGATCRCR